MWKIKNRVYRMVYSVYSKKIFSRHTTYEIRNTKYGFTLIELLITTSILAIIAVAIFSTFAAGVKVYARVQAYGGVQADVLLFLEKMERDLRNVISSGEIDFIGNKERISFAGVINTIDSKGNQKVSLGRILYYIDGIRDILVKEEQDYSQAVLEIRTGKGRARDLVFLENINFSYYYFNSETQKYDWKDSWEAEETKDEGREAGDEKESRIPLGVKVEVTFNDGNRNVRLDRTVFIPISGGREQGTGNRK